MKRSLPGHMPARCAHDAIGLMTQQVVKERQ